MAWSFSTILTNFNYVSLFSPSTISNSSWSSVTTYIRSSLCSLILHLRSWEYFSLHRKQRPFSFLAWNSTSDSLLIGPSFLFSPLVTPLKVIVRIGNVVFPLFSLGLELRLDLWTVEGWDGYLTPTYPLRLASPWIISQFSTNWATWIIWDNFWSSSKRMTIFQILMLLEKTPSKSYSQHVYHVELPGFPEPDWLQFWSSPFCNPRIFQQ